MNIRNSLTLDMIGDLDQYAYDDRTSDKIYAVSVAINVRAHADNRFGICKTVSSCLSLI